ncbi:coiled-coil domain-containing protein 87-like isoform X2 [Dendronephthya gigantea]|nr:coiled-coil domain-containing protein 87-like isoform X2 [Dendronephthya gigantea]
MVAESDDETEGGQEMTRPLSGLEKRSRSLPNLLVGESLLEELGITTDHGRRLGRKDSVDNMGINLACSGMVASIDSANTLGEVGKQDSNYMAADLKRLVSDETLPKLPKSEQEEDLPPLLQALSYQSTRKKKVLQPSYEADRDESVEEIASTVASSVACHEDIDDDDVVHPAPPVQPATVSTRLPDKSVVRTSDVRVSNRVNKSEMTLKTFPTVYNDLIGEIDAATVKWLDRNLYIGDEIREVYEEVIKTVGKSHLLFDQDPYVENHATGVDLSPAVHSTLLTGSKDNRIINTSLHRDVPPPWGRHEMDEWKNSPKFGDLGRQDILNIGSQGLHDYTGKASKSYNSWLAWWRSTINIDDYFKYLSTQDNDYLSLTYHLYESDDSDSENDGDKDRKPNARELELKRAREEKIAEIRKLKENYNVGYWNANSVLLGGLGKYPDITDEELGINAEPSIDSPSRDEDNSLTPSSPLTNKDRSEAGTPLSLQDRLERVWTLLRMPDNLKLDMAIKYSSETYMESLEEVLQHWETAVKLILAREALIMKLEDFERLASDPNRFFERGSPGSASSRIKEAKTRKQLHHKLDMIEVRIKKIVVTIHETFSDVVTFQGRPYLEKMSSDRTEMLYWLQQERRETALDMAKKTVELRMLEIPTTVNNVV